MKSWNRMLCIALLIGGLLGINVDSRSQTRKHGVLDDFNDLRGVNPLGIVDWGMGGVRTAMEGTSGSLIYAPAGMAWGTPPFLSGEFDVRTYFPRGKNILDAESQTLFMPRWVGMAFMSGRWRFGFGYAVPYGHRRVYDILGSNNEYVLAEQRLAAPVAFKIAPQLAAGATVGFSYISWKENIDGSGTDNSATGLGFASAVDLQWKPRPDLMFGAEAEPPIIISGDAKINAVTFHEQWKRPLGLRTGVQKRWDNIRTAADVYFRQYSALDNWEVDRGVMSHDQYGVAVGAELPYSGALLRFGGQAETDPVDGNKTLTVMITAGLGWSLGGFNINTAVVDSHASTDRSVRGTRFLLGLNVLPSGSD
jgi:hypothetical protein